MAVLTSLNVVGKLRKQCGKAGRPCRTVGSQIQWKVQQRDYNGCAISASALYHLEP